MQKTFVLEVSIIDSIWGILIIALLFGIGYLFGRWVKHRSIMRERGDAIGRSRSVILGELYETLAPILPGFPYAPRDMVFLGK